MVYMSFFYRCSRWFHRQVTGGSVTEQGHHVCRTGLVHSRDPWAYPARKHTALWVVSRCYLSAYLHPGCHLPFIQGPRTGGSYREVCLLAHPEGCTVKEVLHSQAFFVLSEYHTSSYPPALVTVVFCWHESPTFLKSWSSSTLCGQNKCMLHLQLCLFYCSVWFCCYSLFQLHNPAVRLLVQVNATHG